MLHTFVTPVTMPMASIRIASRSFFLSWLVQLSQTTPLYSSVGPMKDIYIRSRDFLSNLNLKALSILRRCQALAVISVIWLCQFKSEEKVIPR